MPVSVLELKAAISRCNFLFDYQKERLIGMLDNGLSGSDGDNSWGEDDPTTVDDMLSAVDGILWSTIGVSLPTLPVWDRVIIERAVRDSCRL